MSLIFIQPPTRLDSSQGHFIVDGVGIHKSRHTLLSQKFLILSAFLTLERLKHQAMNLTLPNYELIPTKL